jgi:hypothetical protein
MCINILERKNCLNEKLLLPKEKLLLPIEKLLLPKEKLLFHKTVPIKAKKSLQKHQQIKSIASQYLLCQNLRLHKATVIFFF